MKSWLCIPSARPIAEVLPVVATWKERGYGVALQRDWERGGEEAIAGADVVTYRKYAGYADAVNFLAADVLRNNCDVDWIVCAGDDTFPDPNKTGDEIARELSAHFAVLHSLGGVPWPKCIGPSAILEPENAGTWGVMQPTGHRWGEEDPGARQRWPDAPAYIDRVCGSPFLGREFCRRANAGLGPLHPAYFHMHSDEHTQEYAKSLGILWQRPDLTHFHNHWGLTGDAWKMPEFLKFVNSPEHWRESKSILDHHKSTNFAECQPIP